MRIRACPRCSPTRSAAVKSEPLSDNSLLTVACSESGSASNCSRICDPDGRHNRSCIDIRAEITKVDDLSSLDYVSSAHQVLAARTSPESPSRAGIACSKQAADPARDAPRLASSALFAAAIRSIGVTQNHDSHEPMKQHTGLDRLLERCRSGRHRYVCPLCVTRRHAKRSYARQIRYQSGLEQHMRLCHPKEWKSEGDMAYGLLGH